MKEIKKLMITLVALLALTTGAWADGIVCTASDLGKVLCTDGSIYENVSAATTAGKTAAAMIAYVDETNKNGLALALTDEDAMTWDNSAPSNKGKTAPELCSALNTSKAVTGGTWKLPSQDEWKQMFSANGGNEGSYSGLNTAIGNAGGTALLESEEYWSSSEVDYDAWLVNLADGNASWGTEGKHYQRCVRACLAFDIAASSGPEVAWNKATKTGTFKMPGGNVTLEPEYYPQATVADGGVTAADADARATTDDPLVKVDATKLTGAKKLMYFVSNSGTTAPAYDAEGWTDQLPTAEGLTQQGIVYVWYYPVGTDEGVDGATATYSDGDICLQSITARIAPEPTYAVTYAEGTQDADKWTVKAGTDGSFQSLPLKGVKAGTKVKLKYDGDRSMVKGVKATSEAKKAAYEHSITIAVDPSTIGAIATAPAMTIEFNTGETWADVAARYDWLGTYENVTVFYKDNTLMGNVHDANGGVTPDQTIDPNGSYHWGM